mgnify:FL=1
MVLLKLIFCVVVAFGLPPDSTQSSVRVTADPVIEVPETPVLRGDPIEIRISGLAPRARVTIIAERTWGRRRPAVYRSTARYAADDDGVLNLSTAKPLEAPWEGVDPSGLFWSMKPTKEDVPAGRSSNDVEIMVDVDDDGEAEASAVVRSIRGRDDLVETPMGDDFPGAFLLRPPGNDPLPAIMVLGGSEGGDSAARRIAPKLASRGYAVVGFPYHSPAYWGQKPQFPELPRAFHDIPIDRLEMVRDWLRKRDDIQKDRIALYGVSKGSEFALLAGSLIDGFSGIVAYVPSDVVWEAWGPGTTEGENSCFSWRGEPLPFLPYKGMSAEIAKFRTGERVRMRTPHDAGRAAHPERIAAARIHVEKIDEPVFIVGADADDVWDSGEMARNILAARKKAGLKTVAIIDPKAGHGLSGDGYTPTSAPEGRVQGKAFPAMLQFLDECLRDRERTSESSPPKNVLLPQG